MAASAAFALKPGVWFRRGRLLIVSPDSLGTACPLSGRNSTYRPVQILEASSVWVLLHFIYSTAPFNAVGNTSACDHVLREVQKHLPTYAKGSQRTFDDLSKHMMQAIKHAIQLWKHN